MRSTVARLAAHVAPGGVLILDGWIRPDEWRERVRPEHDYFVESHRLALTPTQDFVSAVESAGLNAQVIPDYMPARDRIVGQRKR